MSIATSDIHMHYKLKMTREEVVKAAVEAVRYCKTLTENVEFSAEDGSRSDRDFLCKVFEAAIEAGWTAGLQLIQRMVDLFGIQRHGFGHDL